MDQRAECKSCNYKTFRRKHRRSLHDLEFAMGSKI